MRKYKQYLCFRYYFSQYNRHGTKAYSAAVIKTAQIESPALAAEMFLMVSPVMEKAPSLFPKMLAAMENEFKMRLGNEIPMHSPLLALVFEAIK